MSTRPSIATCSSKTQYSNISSMQCLTITEATALALIPTSSDRECISNSVPSITSAVALYQQQLSMLRRTMPLANLSSISSSLFVIATATSARQPCDSALKEYLRIQGYKIPNRIRKEPIWRRLQAAAAKMERYLKEEKAGAELLNLRPPS